MDVVLNQVLVNLRENLIILIPLSIGSLPIKNNTKDLSLLFK